MEKTEIVVTGCNECPMHSTDIDDSEYCGYNGSPYSRYYQDENGEWKAHDTPNDCPLLKEQVTVKLK